MAGVEVEVQIAAEFARLVTEGRLAAVARAALQQEGAEGEVTLVITDDEGIQELNRDFLGKDAPTDVLAFSAREDGGPFLTAPDAGGYLGDSYPRAVAQAEDQGHQSNESSIC
jgi:probable rRNA maturation factor